MNKKLIGLIMIIVIAAGGYCGHLVGKGSAADSVVNRKTEKSESKLNFSFKSTKNDVDDIVLTEPDTTVLTTMNNPTENDYSVVPPGDALPNVTARSAVVMEAATGKVLYQRNMDQLRYPASTTKMMTLIVALENSQPDEIVTASENASGTEGSTIWLEVGEKLKMEDLMYGMMLVSGNDATVAVAEHIAGSVPKYAKMMTKKAREIGAKNTQFANSSGLPDPRHYSTAYDLALIASYGYKNPEFEKIVGTKEEQIPWAANDYNRALYNENRMLWIYDGGNGVKTGYTDAAGRCLVSAAKRDGVQLVAVVLDALYMWNDSIAMLDYGFKQITPMKIIRKGEKLEKQHIPYGDKEKISVHAAEDVSVGAVSGDRKEFSLEYEMKEGLSAPLKKGSKVGKVYVIYEGKRIASTDMIADEDVGKTSQVGSILEVFRSLFK